MQYTNRVTLTLIYRPPYRLNIPYSYPTYWYTYLPPYVDGVLDQPSNNDLPVLRVHQFVYLPTNHPKDRPIVCLTERPISCTGISICPSTQTDLLTKCLIYRPGTREYHKCWPADQGVCVNDLGCHYCGPGSIPVNGT